MPRNDIKVEFKILRSERRMTKTNEPYYVLELLNMSGDKHETRIWKDAIKEQYLPQEGHYFGNVKSHENLFRGQRQMVIDDYWLFKPEEVHTAVKDQFVEPSVIDADQVIARMFDWPFWDKDMHDLMQKVREHLKHEGVWEKIKAIPAGASYHHNVRGGFLLHIDEMLDFSEQLCGVCVFGQSPVTPNRDPNLDVIHVTGPSHSPGLVDYQILRAGIVLHDIGKVYDYDDKTLQFQSNPISDCLEHTLVGILMVERYWKKNSAEALDRGLRLIHVLAAHHGPDMGAVKPKTPEAIILHHIDMISAQLDVCRQAYDNAKKNGNFSEYSRMLGARPFVPSFFPLDTLVYPKSKVIEQMATKETTPDQPVMEKIEFKGEHTERLPWED